MTTAHVAVVQHTRQGVIVEHDRVYMSPEQAAAAARRAATSFPSASSYELLAREASVRRFNRPRGPADDHPSRARSDSPPDDACTCCG